MFDNPIFWIVVVWWLFTTFLGAKARRKRRAARATSQERRTAPLPGPAREREEPGYVGEVESDAEEMEREPALPPIPVRSPVRPTTPMEQLWRGLGIEPEVVQFRGVADWEEEDIEVAPPSPEPDPEPVDLPAPQPTTVPGRVKAETSAVPTVHRRQANTISQAVAGLTPLQQAVVLKEILDRPRALRRGIR